jgi:hypothetical protein
LTGEAFEQIEQLRRKSLKYESQRDQIIKIIESNGGSSEMKIETASKDDLDQFKGYYPITIKLGITEKWPNFYDWCSEDYERERKNKAK